MSQVLYLGPNLELRMKMYVHGLRDTVRIPPQDPLSILQFSYNLLSRPLNQEKFILWTERFVRCPEKQDVRLIKVRLWVLMRDQTLTHLSSDISLIPKPILNHNISLKT